MKLTSTDLSRVTAQCVAVPAVSDSLEARHLKVLLQGVTLVVMHFGHAKTCSATADSTAQVMSDCLVLALRLSVSFF